MSEYSEKTDNSIKPSIAVIVPVYNVERYLPQCIESILGQTRKDFTLYLIDDGSGDGSGAVCDRYAAQDERIRVVHKDNEGLMRTWMRGAELSTEPYLCFLDGDDWIDGQLLEKLSEHLTGSGKEIVCSGYVIEHENGRKENKDNEAPEGEYTGAGLESEIKKNLLGNERRTLIMSRCMKLISRDLILDNLRLTEPKIRMGEDVNITFPAMLDAERIVVLRGAFWYHYRFLDSSMVHRYDAGMLKNNRLLADTLLKAADEKDRDGRLGLKSQVEREFFYLMLLVLKSEIRRRDITLSELAANLRKICEGDHLKERMSSLKESPSDPASRILCAVIKNPGLPTVLAARTAFRIKDRGRGFRAGK